MTVLNVTQPNMFTAAFAQSHAAGATVTVPTATITIPGNPGPQPLFDLRDKRYAPVVPYWTVVN